MTKTAHLLTSLLFAIVCLSVWFLWKLGSDILGQFVPPSEYSALMAISMKCYPWMLALPVPGIIYSAVVMDRVELLVEKAMAYFITVSLTSAVLILGSMIIFVMEVATMTLRIGPAVP